MEMIPSFRDNFHMIHHVASMISDDTSVSLDEIIKLIRWNIIPMKTVKEYGVIKDYYKYRESGLYGRARQVLLGIIDRYSLDENTASYIIYKKRHYYTEHYFKLVKTRQQQNKKSS